MGKLGNSATHSIYNLPKYSIKPTKMYNKLHATNKKNDM